MSFSNHWLMVRRPVPLWYLRMALPVRIEIPGRAELRPTGLAEGPDGVLYVSDDVHGRIWRITYNGDGSDKVASAPAAVVVAADGSSAAVPPEGEHPDAGRPSRPLSVPPGATAGRVALGDRIFHGEASNGTCSGCHGSDAGGSPQGPPLNRGHWLWSDGSLAGLTATIEKGVAQPKQYQGVMPPLGGAPPIWPQDVAAVSAYVWALGSKTDPSLILIWNSNGRFAVRRHSPNAFTVSLRADENVLCRAQTLLSIVERHGRQPRRSHRAEPDGQLLSSGVAKR